MKMSRDFTRLSSRLGFMPQDQRAEVKILNNITWQILGALRVMVSQDPDQGSAKPYRDQGLGI